MSCAFAASSHPNDVERRKEIPDIVFQIRAWPHMPTDASGIAMAYFAPTSESVCKMRKWSVHWASAVAEHWLDSGFLRT